MDFKMEATMEGQVCVTISPIGLVIGQIAEGEITQPRVLVTGRKDDKIQVEFKKMLGDPKIFERGGCPAYISNDNELNVLYIEEISVIKVVSTVPVNMTIH
jgi:hypothetical protein